jgi:hypothetical protein
MTFWATSDVLLAFNQPSARHLFLRRAPPPRRRQCEHFSWQLRGPQQVPSSPGRSPSISCAGRALGCRVLTGTDAQYYEALNDGAMLLSAHDRNLPCRARAAQGRQT